MTDADQHDAFPAWLPLDDQYLLNGVLLIAATSLALALSSCLRRMKHHSDHTEHRAVERHMQEHPSSILTAALSSFHLLQSQSPECPMSSSAQKLPLPDTLAPHDGEQKDQKSTRSKERRRRGKDPLKDLFKAGKKSKPHTSIKTNENERDEASSTPPPSSELDQKSSTLGIDSSSCTSRSASPDVSRQPSDHLRLPKPSADDGSVSHPTIPSSGGASDHSCSSHSLQADGVRHLAPPEAEVNISSSSTIVVSAPDTSLSPSATSAEPNDPRASQPRNSQPESSSGSFSSKPIRIRAKLRTSRIDSSVHLPASLSAPDKAPSQASTPLPSFPSAVSCPAMSSTNYSADGVGPSTPTNSRRPTPSPCRSLQRSPSPSLQSSSQGTSQNDTPVSAQTQLASMRGALEAARLREEKLRAEADQANKERDELCWRWNEEAGGWRQREAELQAQIHHLMQQLQAYAVVASFQTHQAQNRPSSGFSSPTSPHPHSSPRLPHHPLFPFPPAPTIQVQNSANASAHVQALLAAAPMLTSHHPGFGLGVGIGGVGAAGNGGVYSGSAAGGGMSPLLWSGLGLGGLNRDPRNGGHRTPDSSASGSSSRGRRRRKQAEDVKSASDDSSLGDCDGVSMEDGSGPDPDGGAGDRWYQHGSGEGQWDGEGEGEDEEDEWEEDVFRKNMLADAILKRPESIRGLSRVGKRSTTGVRASSRTSVRPEGATPGPAVMPLTNGTGVVDPLTPEVGKESEPDVGVVPLASPVDNVMGKTTRHDTLCLV